jgi:aspartyl-tRNA(Asn)/glutamyl-tRNA(Gln) amidotransferase subunit A
VALKEIADLSAAEQARLVRSKDATPSDLVRAALERIEAQNGALNAFVHICADRAIEEARVLERRIAAGEDPGPLAGVPLGVKDLEDVGGLPTTFGSIPFRDHVAAADSPQVARLRAAGAIVVGKTNTPEFGYTALTHNRLFGTTRNPWDLARTPGGSSGGSAAAVASRMVPLATASDGGGSVRIPACYVGAFGFKPTFGRIPIGVREGLAMQRWVDTVHYGPITRTVEDAALFLDVTAGYHPEDPNSLPAPAESYVDAYRRVPRKLKIAFSRDLGYARVQSDVMREVEAAVCVLRDLGHEVVEIDTVFPDLGYAWAFMCGAEDHAVVAQHVAGRETDMGRGYWKGLEMASTLTADQQGKFQRERAQLNATVAELFSRFDVLVTPTLPTEAFSARGPLPTEIDGKALASPLHAVAFSYPFNMTGHPAATMRAGMTDAGLPAGLQIVAERHRDDLVLALSAQYEDARSWDSWPEPV